jgi:hypothetical protein
MRARYALPIGITAAVLTTFGASALACDVRSTTTNAKAAPVTGYVIHTSSAADSTSTLSAKAKHDISNVSKVSKASKLSNLKASDHPSVRRATVTKRASDAAKTVTVVIKHKTVSASDTTDKSSDQVKRDKRHCPGHVRRDGDRRHFGWSHHHGRGSASHTDRGHHNGWHHRGGRH